MGTAAAEAVPPAQGYSPLSVAAFVLYHLGRLCRQHPATGRAATLANSQLPFCVVEDGDLNEALAQISSLLAVAHAELERSRAAAAAAAFDVRRAALASIVENCLCILEANVRCRSRANDVVTSGAHAHGVDAARQRIVVRLSALASDAAPAIRRGAVALFATYASANFWFPSAEAQAMQLLALLSPPASDAAGAAAGADAGAPSELLAPFAEALCHPSARIVKLVASSVDVAERVLARLLDAAFAPSADAASPPTPAGRHSRVALMRLLLVLQRRVASELAASLQRCGTAPPALTALTARYGRDVLQRSAAWVAASSGAGARHCGGRSSPVALLLPPMLATLSLKWVFPSTPVNAPPSSGVGAHIAAETTQPLYELFKQLNAANLRACAPASRSAATPARGVADVEFGTPKLLKRGAESWHGVECVKGADALALRFRARCTSASASDVLTVRRGGKHTWKRTEVVDAAAVIPRLSAIGGARKVGGSEAAAAPSARHSWPSVRESFIVPGDTIALNWNVEGGGRSGRSERMPPRPGPFGGGGRDASGGGSASAEASCFALTVTPIYLNARRGRDASLPWLLALQVRVAHCAGRFIADLAAGSTSAAAENAANTWLAAPLFVTLAPIGEKGRAGESESESGAERSVGTLAARFCNELAEDAGGAAKVYAWVEQKKAKKSLRKPKKWTLSPSDALTVRRVVLAALVRHGIAGSSSSSGGGDSGGGGGGALRSIVGGPALAARLDAIAESTAADVGSALEDASNAACATTLKDLWAKADKIVKELNARRKQASEGAAPSGGAGDGAAVDAALLRANDGIMSRARTLLACDEWHRGLAFKFILDDSATTAAQLAEAREARQRRASQRQQGLELLADLLRESSFPAATDALVANLARRMRAVWQRDGDFHYLVGLGGATRVALRGVQQAFSRLLDAIFARLRPSSAANVRWDVAFAAAAKATDAGAAGALTSAASPYVASIALNFCSLQYRQFDAPLVCECGLLGVLNASWVKDVASARAAFNSLALACFTHATPDKQLLASIVESIRLELERLIASRAGEAERATSASAPAAVAGAPAVLLAAVLPFEGEHFVFVNAVRGANVRAEASEAARIVARMPYGTVFEADRVQEGWVRIENVPLSPDPERSRIENVPLSLAPALRSDASAADASAAETWISTNDVDLEQAADDSAASEVWSRVKGRGRARSKRALAARGSKSPSASVSTSASPAAAATSPAAFDESCYRLLKLYALLPWRHHTPDPQFAAVLTSLMGLDACSLRVRRLACRVLRVHLRKLDGAASGIGRVISTQVLALLENVLGSVRADRESSSSGGDDEGVRGDGVDGTADTFRACALSPERPRELERFYQNALNAYKPKELLASQLQRTLQRFRASHYPLNALVAVSKDCDASKLRSLEQRSKVLVASGEKVLLAQLPPRSTDVNRLRATKGGNRLACLSGEVATNFASELVALLREMCASDAAVHAAITSAAQQSLAALCSAQQQERASAVATALTTAAIGAVCVLGGFTEALRIGGQVELDVARGGRGDVGSLRSASAGAGARALATPRGTLVAYTAGIAEASVLFCASASGEQRGVVVVPVEHLRPVAESRVPPAAAATTSALLEALLNYLGATGGRGDEAAAPDEAEGADAAAKGATGTGVGASADARSWHTAMLRQCAAKAVCAQLLLQPHGDNASVTQPLLSARAFKRLIALGSVSREGYQSGVSLPVAQQRLQRLELRLLDCEASRTPELAAVFAAARSADGASRGESGCGASRVPFSHYTAGHSSAPEMPIEADLRLSTMCLFRAREFGCALDIEALPSPGEAPPVAGAAPESSLGGAAPAPSALQTPSVGGWGETASSTLFASPVRADGAAFGAAAAPLFGGGVASSSAAAAAFSFGGAAAAFGVNDQRAASRLYQRSSGGVRRESSMMVCQGGSEKPTAGRTRVAYPTPTDAAAPMLS